MSCFTQSKHFSIFYWNDNYCSFNRRKNSIILTWNANTLKYHTYYSAVNCTEKKLFEFVFFYLVWFVFFNQFKKVNLKNISLFTMPKKKKNSFDYFYCKYKFHLLIIESHRSSNLLFYTTTKNIIILISMQTNKQTNQNPNFTASGNWKKPQKLIPYKYFKIFYFILEFHLIFFYTMCVFQ